MDDTKTGDATTSRDADKCGTRSAILDETVLEGSVLSLARLKPGGAGASDVETRGYIAIASPDGVELN